MTQHLVTRRSGITAQQLGAEVVLLDPVTQQVHALDSQAGALWALCDGTRTVEGIAARSGLSPDRTSGVLRELDDLGLLERTRNVAEIDRRAMFARTARLGAGAAIAATVVSIALPAAAAAHSGQSYTYSFTNNTSPNFGLYTVTTATGTTLVTNAGGMSSTDYFDTVGGARTYYQPGVIQVQAAVTAGGNLTLQVEQVNAMGSADYTTDGGTNASGDVTVAIATDLGQPISGTFTVFAV